MIKLGRHFLQSCREQQCTVHTSKHVPSFWHGESAHVSCIQDEDGWHCVVVTAVVVTGVLKVVPLSGNMVLQVSPVIIYQNRDY